VSLEKLSPAVEDALLGPGGSAIHDRANAATGRQRVLLTRIQRATVTCFGLAQDLAKGFAARAARTAAPVNVKPRKRTTDLSEHFSEWMRVDSGHEAMTWTLRMFVLIVCAELEHFLRDLAKWHLSDAQLARIRGDRACPNNLPKARAKARAALVTLVRPSSGKPSDWPRRLRLVFGTRIPRPITDALRILIRWRHEYSHRNNPPHEIDWSGEADAIEAMITWWLTTIAFSEHLVAETRRR
jgi:hypothetical protein